MRNQVQGLSGHPVRPRSRLGHGIGHRASCSINQIGTDGPGGALGGMKITAVNDLSFRNGTQVESPRENVNRSFGPSQVIRFWYFSGLWCSDVSTVLW